MRYVILVSCLICTVGCGAYQVKSDSPPVLRWESTVGGAYLAACVTGNSGWFTRSYAIEKWTVQAGLPVRETSFAVGKVGQSEGLQTLRCTPSKVGAELKGAGAQWLDLAGNKTTPGVQIIVGSTLAKDTEVSIPMGGEKRLKFRRTGRAVMEDSRFLDWRPVPNDIEDAVFDGRYVWAVAPRNLWRWTPGTQRILNVALPAEVGARKLVSLFRDGSLIWLRTADGLGWPLHIMGGLARLVKAPGPLPHIQNHLSLPLGVFRIQHKKPGAALRLVDELGGLAQFPKGGVNALLPMTRRHLLISRGTRVELWDLGSNPPVQLNSWTFPGPIVRFFTDGKHILAIGQSSGFHWGRISSDGFSSPSKSPN